MWQKGWAKEWKRKGEGADNKEGKRMCAPYENQIQCKICFALQFRRIPYYMQLYMWNCGWFG